MSSVLAAQLCRIVPPEKLSDRLLAAGTIRQTDNNLLSEQVLLGYIFEVTHPMFTTSTLLHSLLEVLQEGVAGFSVKKNIDDQFELLLKSVNEKLNALSEGGETDWIGNLNGIITVLTGEELHFAQTGRCPAYLLQNNRIRQITDDAGDHDPHPLKTFSNLASGMLREGDQILFGNSALYRELSLDALRRVLNNGTPYQSCLSIARELKREKNQGVASLVIRVVPPEELPKDPEPESILLEIEMQSGIMKLKRQLTPFASGVKRVSGMVAAASMEAAKQTSTVVKEKVVPKAGELITKGVEKAQSLRESVTDAEAETFIDEPVGPPPTIEIIPSRKQRERAHLQAMAEAAESRAENRSEAEQEEEVIIAEDPIVETPVAEGFLPKALFFLQKTLPHLFLKVLGHTLTWLKIPRNRKIAALGVGVLLLTGTVWAVVKPKENQQSSELVLENATKIEQVKEQDKLIATAIQLQQEIEAGRTIEEAQNKLLSLVEPTEDQKKEADSLWVSIQTKADGLSKTTRLSAPASVYSFPDESNTLLSVLPYFFGSSKTRNVILRTGKGDPAQVDGTISLADPNDSVISIARSSEVDTVSYIFTKQNKVYRIVQSGNDTSMSEITTKDGEFDVGDAIGSYASNLYILDGKTGLLWKYGNSGNGNYGSRESVIDSTKYDIKKSISLAIDGSIYVLKQDSSLLKFNRGKQDTAFALNGQPYLSRKLISPVQVITSDTMSSIFVLDSGTTTAGHSTAKVLEFSKNGAFTRQYAFPDGNTNVRAFDINPKEKKLWILNGSQINEFDI